MKKQKNKTPLKKQTLFLQLFLIAGLAITTYVITDQTLQRNDLRGRAQTLNNCDVSEIQLSMTASEQQLLQLINQHRAQNAAPPLLSSPQLKRAAEWQSNHMATGGPFNHTDGTGRNPGQRAKDCGFLGSVSENIAYNTDKTNSAAKTFDQWKNSPGHNTNMLKITSTQVGLAEAISADGKKHYWTFVASTGIPIGKVPTAKPLPPTLAPTNTLVPTQITIPTVIATSVPPSPTHQAEPTMPQNPTPTFACLGGCPISISPTSIALPTEPTSHPEPTGETEPSEAIEPTQGPIPTVHVPNEQPQPEPQPIPSNQGLIVLILILIIQILRGVFGGF